MAQMIRCDNNPEHEEKLGTAQSSWFRLEKGTREYDFCSWGCVSEFTTKQTEEAALAAYKKSRGDL